MGFGYLCRRRSASLVAATTVLSVALLCGRVMGLIPFDRFFYILYGQDHATSLEGGDLMQLSMDQTTGAGFRSKVNYFSGSFEMKIKLPATQNNSGVITTYYMTSFGKHHTEIDLEFLGEKTLQTNIYIDDVGNREQRVKLWFDAAADFHAYKILWNPNLVLLTIDNVPIRMFKNKPGQPYLTKPMSLMGTMWSAPDWAGAVDWSKAPFITQYKGPFDIDGCPARLGPVVCAGKNMKWNTIEGLSPKQEIDYPKFKAFRYYDYCTDPTRQPPVVPNEC